MANTSGGAAAKLAAEGLGGGGNIVSPGSCLTRLRVTVRDPRAVSDSMLGRSGALAVIRKGRTVEVAYGPRAAAVKESLENVLKAHKSAL